MGVIQNLYEHSLALLTDLYQLTMAYGYWKLGMAEREAVFHLNFRKQPFGGGFSVACGLHEAIEYLQALRFDASDLDYVASLTGNDGKPLFDRGFMEYLGRFRFACDVDAIPEGTVVFPYEPLVRVTGPLLQAQLLETPLLNIINFSTLIATKAARVCQAARGDPVLEFGLRRAQGIDGGVTASRAAFVGGCAATSNVLAGKLFGIPCKGTHAHSWVMAFGDELEAFEAYASAMPNNCVFLVDTYDTLQGVRHAVQVGKKLRERGHEMVGIRLDSGDLAYLSIEARKILDAGGFPKAQILASNDLDETIIASLKEQGARVVVWGVGTKLATAYDNPALGGVYKISALRGPDGQWEYKLKLSEQTAKMSIPGILQVRRFRGPDGLFSADAMYDTGTGISQPLTIVDPADSARRKSVPADAAGDDLLVPVFRAGNLVYQTPVLRDVQRRTSEQLAALHPSIKRLVNPHRFPAGLELQLHDLRTRLIDKVRQADGAAMT
ncbi:MAG TPA: nicotinate phosphoribosyltransferase [Tepidisphaeraceae bacterium]|nr:nicotinate phosphoribosyltransferase [Tepidisphaeraceae bacterium]